MSNMNDVWWRPGTTRRGPIVDPIGPETEGYDAPCLACPRPLGGEGHQRLQLQLVVVGPAVGDDEGRRRHAAGLHYNAAGLWLHAECAAAMDDPELEKFLAGMRMVRRAPRSVDAQAS